MAEGFDIPVGKFCAHYKRYCVYTPRMLIITTEEVMLIITTEERKANKLGQVTVVNTKTIM